MRILWLRIVLMTLLCACGALAFQGLQEWQEAIARGQQLVALRDRVLVLETNLALIKGLCAAANGILLAIAGILWHGFRQVRRDTLDAMQAEMERLPCMRGTRTPHCPAMETEA